MKRRIVGLLERVPVVRELRERGAAIGGQVVELRAQLADLRTELAMLQPPLGWTPSINWVRQTPTFTAHVWGPDMLDGLYGYSITKINGSTVRTEHKAAGSELEAARMCDEEIRKLEAAGEA